MEEGTRREFLELATLLGTGVVLAGGATGIGPTDFHIQHVVLEPGADSGWHTHPGVALDIVTAGTVTAYLDEGQCQPVKVTAGQAFLFPAGVTHIARNEGDEPAEVYVTYLTAGADPRADAASPGSCPPPK